MSTPPSAETSAETSVEPSVEPSDDTTPGRSLRGRVRPVVTLALSVVLVATGLGSVPEAFAQLVAPVAATDGAAAEEDVTQYVDPFVSTEDDFGQDLPGAQAPHGLAKVNPMTTPGRSHSGYDYAATKIAGFTTTDLDGVGGSGGGGDLLVVPTYVTYTKRPATSSYAKSYSHDDEEATPGYYRVGLTPTQGTDGTISDVAGAKIQAEVTADVRSAFERFTFPNAGTASLVLDLQNNFTSRVGADLSVTRLADGRAAISGRVVGSFNGPSYTLSYYAETTAPVKAVRTWGPDGALTTATRQSGTDIGAVIDVDVAAGGAVELKATLSPISVEQAATDMANELGARTFDEVRAGTKAQWNDVLSRVAVDAGATSDPDGSLKKLFYTHLYRMFGLPMNATSTDGTYRGADGVVYQTDGTHYDSWSLWDDFRKYSVLALVAPQDYQDVVQSLVDLYASFANTSAGSVGGLMQSVPTTRFERAPVVIADAVSKGVRLDDLDLAYAGLARQVGTGYNAANTALGYLADDVDDTLGTAYDDWAMSVIADALGKDDDASSYRQRATNYTNLFNPAAWTNPAGEQVGLISPRNASGAWWTGVNPEQFQAANLYQGTPWQYNWYVASDMGGMVQLMGGRENALSAVSYFFGEQAPDDGSRMLHSNANEIDLQAPYLFNYVGAPSRTQYWARSIATKATWNRYIATDSTGEAPSGGGEFRPPVEQNVFRLSPQGFLPTMDNDAGTMSATFVADALGLFPVTAGSDTYQIGSPIFDRVTIDRRDGGRPFTITADGVSPDSYYIQSARLDGADLDQTWVRYSDVVGGGDLRFQMGPDPSQWAADGPQPDSLSDHVDSAVYERRGGPSLTTSSRVFDEADANDGTVGTTVTVTARGTAFAGADGADLVASGAVTATGVPDGLALRAVKASDDTVELSLTGTARSHLRDDSAALTVSFAGAVTTPVAAGAGALALRVDFVGYTLTASDLTVTAADDGTVADTATLTLGGGVRFAGAAGSDLLATGAARLSGLADGLSATLTRTDDTTLVLAVGGTLAVADPSRFTLAFADEAFADGVAATSVTGDGGVLRPFTVTVGADWRARLAALTAEARLEQRGAYSAASFAALTSALAKAQALLDDPASTPGALRQGYFTLSSALDGLEIGLGGYRRLEGEASDTWSGGELKNEAANLGGVKPGSWVGYLGMDFDTPPAAIEVAYSTNATRAPADSAVEVHVDAPDGPLAGTVALPRNGSDWFAFSTVTYAFTDPSVLADATSVYFVFRGSVTGDLPWVANIEHFQFRPTLDAPRFGNLDTTNASELHPGIDKSAPMFQNVNDQEWAAYRGYDFGSAGAATLTVSYDKPSTRTTEDTFVEVRLGSLDAAPAAVVALAFTGSGWGTYATATVDVDPAVFRGTKDVYVVFRAPAADGGHPYVANIPWLRFGAPTTPAADRFHLEAESFAASSGGALGTETNTDPSGVPYVNLKGTSNGDWLRYDGVDLGESTATSVTVRYVNNSARCGANSRIEVYLDERAGDPVAVVPLPVTGSSWSAVGTTTFALPTALTGAHTVFLVLRTEPDGAHPYVANIDWLDLTYGVDLGPLRAAIAEYAPLADQGDRYLAADFRAFTAALDAAVALVGDPTATAEDVTSATRTLRLAAGQLEWKVVRQLRELVALAQVVDPATVTEDSYAALVGALDAALHVAPDAGYDERQQAYDDLRGAYDALVVRPVQPVGTVTGTLVPGGRVELAVTGLAPDTAYTLSLHPGPVLLGSGTSDAEGALTVAGDLPADAALGDHTLTLETGDGTVVLSVPVVLETRSGVQELAVTVPQRRPGELGWTIDGHNGLVDLGAATAVGDHFEATGAINPVRVSDTREGSPEWSVSARASDFTGGRGSFSGAYLGWAPALVEAGGGAQAGAPVASGLDGGDGLSVPGLLGRAAGGHAPGEAVLGAGLTLKIPGDVAADSYRARLTITALG